MRAGSTRPRSARRCPKSPRSPRADGFRAALTYDGSDVRGLLALVAAGHGLALLPERALDGVAALPVVGPKLVHRTERLT